MLTVRITLALALCLTAARAASSQTASPSAHVESLGGLAAWCLCDRVVLGAVAGIGVRLPGELEQLSLHLQLAFVPSSSDGTHPGVRQVAIEMALSTARQSLHRLVPSFEFTLAGGRAYFADIDCPPPETPPCPPEGCAPREPDHGHWRWFLMPGISLRVPISPRLGVVPGARLMLPRADRNENLLKLRLDLAVRWRL